jgi:hypothetical protein
MAEINGNGRDETGRPEGCRPLWKNLFILFPFSYQEKGQVDEVH